MKFYSVAQCSYLDKEFGFDPQWLLDYGHLEDLVEQLREAAVGEDEEVHFVTSDQPEDDDLAARLEELADGVKQFVANVCSFAHNLISGVYARPCMLYIF